MIDKKIIILLLLLGVTFRLIFASLIPPLTGNDEPAHLRYAQHILAEKKLPNANLYVEENLAGNEYFQPPLYYFLTAIPIWVVGNPDMQLRILRIFSIFLWVIASYFTCKILSLIKLPTWLSISTLAFMALLPGYVVNSSTTTNDTLVVPLTIMSLLFLILVIKKKLIIKWTILMALFSALTILSKVSGLILIPTALTLIFNSRRKNSRLLLALTYIFLTLTFTFWWFLYNYLTYGNWFGPIESSTAGFTKVPFNPYKIYLIARGTFATFWVTYGPANEIRLPINVYLILFFLTIYALLGNVLYLKKAISKKAKITIENKPAFILSIALISNIALFLIFNINQHQPLGRYLYPSLIQISAIFSTGLYFFTPKVARRFVPSFIILGLLALNIWGAITLSNFYNGLAENFAIYGEDKCQTATYFSSTR